MVYSTLYTMLNLCLFVLFITSIKAATISPNKRETCVDKANAISSNIALKAAQEAKDAELSQAAAGEAAAHQVKEELAQKAVEAAKAAQASLAGKITLVEELTHEKEALKLVLSELSNSKAELENAISAELKSLSEGNGLEKVLNTALHVAEATAEDADHSLKGIDDELDEKDRVLQSAFRRTEMLTKEEEAAKADLEKTKNAAKKAVESASEAKANAMKTTK